MAGSSISRVRNKRRVETVEISQKRPRTRSQRIPIGKVMKVEPPPENPHSPSPPYDLRSRHSGSPPSLAKVNKVEPPPENHHSPSPHGLRSTLSGNPPSPTKKEKITSPENMASSSTSDLDPTPVDDFYFSALHDENDIFPISDEKYAQELQLQEALVSSASQINQNNASSSSSSPFSSTSTPDQHALKKKQPMVTSEETHLPDSFCDICMDNKVPSEMFRNEKVCSHLFCLDCIGRHVSAKIKENIAMVRCPDPKCRGVIGPELCRSFVPKEVLERWEEALCESLILGSEKFYCPFKDCSAMLVDDGGKEVTSSECPNCNRLFCAQCKVAWHSGMDCMEFKSLNKDERNSEDIMLMNLAKNKSWKRCPSCKFYVEKRDGCLHISCRCGNHFCYGCGETYKVYEHHICRR